MIGVLGSGSWATAVVKLLTEQTDAQVCWYVREADIRESLVQQGRNSRYLGEVRLDPSQLQVCSTPQEVVERCDTIYLVIPTAFLHDMLQQTDAGLLRTRHIVSAIKGFVPQTDEIVSDYLQSIYHIPEQNIAIISGPTHAEEVASERLTFITVASANGELAEDVQQQIRCKYLNVTLSKDVRAIQFATALKNIYAVAAGICKGMGCGDNLMAVLVSTTIAEMSLFIETVIPGQTVPLTAQGIPPYIGDLLVTCYSQFSRNRTFGTMIGRGYSVRSAQLEMNMVSEGYYAVASLEAIRSGLGMEMPIAQAVYKVLYQNAKPDVLLRAWQIYKA